MLHSCPQEFSLNHAFNASAEIDDAGRYPGLRLFTAAHAVANAPQLDVADKTGEEGVYEDSAWAFSSARAFAPVGQRTFSYFSAVCFLFGRDLYVALDGAVPIGLVASNWGGQAIQVFMSPDALNDTTCGGTVPRSAPSAPAVAVTPTQPTNGDGYVTARGDGDS